MERKEARHEMNYRAALRNLTEDGIIFEDFVGHSAGARLARFEDMATAEDAEIFFRFDLFEHYLYRPDFESTTYYQELKPALRVLCYWLSEENEDCIDEGGTHYYTLKARYAISNCIMINGVAYVYRCEPTIAPGYNSHDEDIAFENKVNERSKEFTPEDIEEYGIKVFRPL